MHHNIYNILPSKWRCILLIEKKQIKKCERERCIFIGSDRCTITVWHLYFLLWSSIFLLFFRDVTDAKKYVCEIWQIGEACIYIVLATSDSEVCVTDQIRQHWKCWHVIQRWFKRKLLYTSQCSHRHILYSFIPLHTVLSNKMNRNERRKKMCWFGRKCVIVKRFVWSIVHIYTLHTSPPHHPLKVKCREKNWWLLWMLFSPIFWLYYQIDPISFHPIIFFYWCVCAPFSNWSLCIGALVVHFHHFCTRMTCVVVAGCVCGVWYSSLPSSEYFLATFIVYAMQNAMLRVTFLADCSLLIQAAMEKSTKHFYIISIG